jgi:hypothetical protein
VEVRCRVISVPIMMMQGPAIMTKGTAGLQRSRETLKWDRQHQQQHDCDR